MKLSRKLKAKSQVLRILRDMDVQSVPMSAFPQAGPRKIELRLRAK